MPKNWLAAHDYFSNRRHKHNNYRRLSANTEVRARFMRDFDLPAYEVWLYSTPIITYLPDGGIELDCYESRTTNSRRNDAGMPTIRSAASMGVPRLKFLGHGRRWDFGRTRFTDMAEMYPRGLPPFDLKIDAEGVVTHVRGEPIERFTEGVLVAIPEAQKERRRLINQARKLLKPWCLLMEAATDVRGTWDFDADDLRVAFSKGTSSDQQKWLIDKHWVDGAVKYTASSYEPSVALMHATYGLLPSTNHHDKTLWRWEQVRPTDL
jgi:hypothetical protein